MEILKFWTWKEPRTERHCFDTRCPVPWLGPRTGLTAAAGQAVPVCSMRTRPVNLRTRLAQQGTHQPYLTSHFSFQLPKLHLQFWSISCFLIWMVPSVVFPLRCSSIFGKHLNRKRADLFSLNIVYSLLLAPEHNSSANSHSDSRTRWGVDPSPCNWHWHCLHAWKGGIIQQVCFSGMVLVQAPGQGGATPQPPQSMEECPRTHVVWQWAKYLFLVDIRQLLSRTILHGTKPFWGFGQPSQRELREHGRCQEGSAC